MQCPSCSAETGNSTSFCPHCGTSLAGAGAGAVPPAQWSTPTPPPEPPPAQSQWSTPPPQYGAPPPQYGAPPPQYGAPPPQYGAPPVAGSGLSDNMAGALAYVTIIPAILFLILDPYKQSSFIRFHSFQSIFLGVGALVIHILLMFIPIIGWIISLLVSLGLFVLWIFLLLNASKGGRFKVPIIGDLAEKQANTF